MSCGFGKETIASYSVRSLSIYASVAGSTMNLIMCSSRRMLVRVFVRVSPRTCNQRDYSRLVDIPGHP